MKVSPRLGKNEGDVTAFSTSAAWPRAEFMLAARQPARLPMWLLPRAPSALAVRRLRWLLALAPLNLALALFNQWLLWGHLPAPSNALARAAAAQMPAAASLSTTNALGAHFAERTGLVLFPRLVPLGTDQPVDDVLLPLGPGGYRYSADSPAEYARSIDTTLASGYVPVAIAGNVVRLERHATLPEPRRMLLSDRLEALLRGLGDGAREPGGPARLALHP